MLLQMLLLAIVALQLYTAEDHFARGDAADAPSGDGQASTELMQLAQFYPKTRRGLTVPCPNIRRGPRRQPSGGGPA